MLKFLYIFARDFVYLFLRLILWCFVIFGLAMLAKFFWSDSFALYFDTVDIYKLNIIRFAALGFCGCVSVFIMLMSIFVPAQWFAQNMFSTEGTLTHTLPVYPACHVISKALAGILMNVMMMFAIVFSVYAFKEGISYFDDIIAAINDVVAGEGSNAEVFSVVLSGIISVLALCFVCTSVCYLSMSMGQLVSGFRNLFIFICFCCLMAISIIVFISVSTGNDVLNITVIDGMQGLVDFVNNIFYTIIWTNIVLGVIYNALSSLIVTYKINL